MISISREEAESFLYLEARLVDERQYDNWLELFAEDGIYWLPIDTTFGPKEHLSLIYDDDLRRRERVHRLSLAPPAQTPFSQTLHVVSNVEVNNGIDNYDAVLTSAQMIYEIRGGDDRQLELGDPRIFAARCEHRLRRHNASWKIVLKRVVLLNRHVPIPNLTFIM